MAEVIQPVADIGFTMLYEPPGEPRMDIIFVHGLQGHPYKTWTARTHLGVKNSDLLRRFRKHTKSSGSSTEKSKAIEAVFWPKDFLPEDCPDCRIVTWGYDSHVSRFLGGPANQNSFFDHAKNLLYAIDRERTSCQGRGIIFVAHSLGGMIVKEVLRRAHSDDEGSIIDIYKSTSAVCFLGTPHRGSSFAPVGNTIRGIVAAAGFDTNERNIKALDFDSIESELSREEFTKDWKTGAFEVRTFQESQGMTGLKGFNGKVVSDFSSSLDDIRERAQHIDANHMEMCRFRSRDDAGYKQVAGEIKSLVMKYNNLNRSKKITTMLESTDKAETVLSENEVLQSLAFPEMDHRRQAIRSPSNNTCNWLKSLSVYQQWSEQGHGFLWLKGKVGAGKSTLMKHALEEMKKKYDGSGAVVVGHFHDARGTQLERSLLGLFRSVVYQLFTQDPSLLAQHLQNLRLSASTGTYAREWKLEAVQEVCAAFLKSWRSSPIFIFIDALDEGDHSQIRQSLSYWEDVVSSASLNGNDVRIFLSSRHYPNVSLRGCSEIWMEDYNMLDISTYVRSKMDLVSSNEEGMELIAIILAKASGVFLWVVLVVEILLRAEDEGKTFGQKRASLQQLPTELEELFGRIFEAQLIDERRDTLRLLKWIALAKRRLMPIEVCFALALESPDPPFSLEKWRASEEYIRDESQMSKMIRTRSRGLAEIKHFASAYSNHSTSAALTHSSTFEPKYSLYYPSQLTSTEVSNGDDAIEGSDEDGIPGDHATTTVQLIHESLAEFLFRRGFRALDELGDDKVVGRFHNELAMCCLKYLNNIDLRYRRFAAARETQYLAFAPHRDIAISSSSGDILVSQLGANTPLEDQLERKYGIQDERTQFPFLDYSVMALLYHCQWAEAQNISQEYLAYGLSGHCGWVFDCWIAFAQRFGMPNVVFEGETCTLLQVLVARNMRSGVKTLLNQPDCSPGPNIDKALRFAALYGHSGLVRLLLSAHADPKASDDLKMTALHIACQNGKTLAAQALLVQQHAPLNAVTTFGWTPLHWAAENGHLDVLRELLTAHANMEIQNVDGETPLLVAVRRGRVAIIDALVSAGTKLDASDSHGRTALHLAASFGLDQVLDLLLHQGKLPIDGCTSDGLTPLALAMIRGKESSAQLLRNWGASAAKLPTNMLDIDLTPERSMTASPNPYQMNRISR